MDTVVVITGASSGIGAALAEQLAARGASIALAARRANALADVAAKCRASTSVTGRPGSSKEEDRVLTIVADVTRRDDGTRIVDETLRHFGRIDVWVNNAGRGLTRMPSQLTDEDIDDMMRVNVKSVVYGMQAVLPHFKERGTGQIINVSSMLGRVPYALVRSAYTGAKHFLNALTAMFREEIQQTHPGIQVSLVSPGVVYTDFGANALHGGLDSKALPGGQTPAEVAAVIVRVIETRQPDVYTRRGAQQEVAAYYASLGSDPDAL